MRRRCGGESNDLSFIVCSRFLQQGVGNGADIRRKIYRVQCQSFDLLVNIEDGLEHSTEKGFEGTLLFERLNRLKMALNCHKVAALTRSENDWFLCGAAD